MENCVGVSIHVFAYTVHACKHKSLLSAALTDNSTVQLHIKLLAAMIERCAFIIRSDFIYPVPEPVSTWIYTPISLFLLNIPKSPLTV